MRDVLDLGYASGFFTNKFQEVLDFIKEIAVYCQKYNPEDKEIPKIGIT